MGGKAILLCYMVGDGLIYIHINLYNSQGSNPEDENEKVLIFFFHCVTEENTVSFSPESQLHLCGSARG